VFVPDGRAGDGRGAPGRDAGCPRKRRHVALPERTLGVIEFGERSRRLLADARDGREFHSAWCIAPSGKTLRVAIRVGRW
jgi:hypothetical protein